MQSRSKRTRSKDTKPLPNMSLNLSRSRVADNLNTSKQFSFKIPSLTRPDPTRPMPDFRQEIMSSSKQRQKARENEMQELDVSSSDSSDLRHKMKNSKIMKISDVFSDNSVEESYLEANVDEWVASKSKENKTSKQRKLAAAPNEAPKNEPYSNRFMAEATKKEETKKPDRSKSNQQKQSKPSKT